MTCSTPELPAVAIPYRLQPIKMNYQIEHHINSNFYICGPYGALAQLARALAWHARGHRFDSDMLHLHCFYLIEFNSNTSKSASQKLIISS